MRNQRPQLKAVACEICEGSGKRLIYLGSDLRSYRKRTLDLSLREAARRLKLSPAYLSDIENGARNATEKIVKLYLGLAGEKIGREKAS